MITVAEALAAAAARLAQAGIAESRLEARVLAAAALELTREALLAHGEAAVAPERAARLADFVARRAAGEPAARILGHKEFWSLDFEVSADTLVPRPESETLIEAVLAAVSDRQAPLTVLDLGTGTGCLLLALLSELPNARGVGVDLNPGAVAMATRNAARLGLAERTRWITADFAADVAAGTLTRERVFDLIVSNPPYVPDSDIAGLAPEVARHDPRLALAGGADGLAAYRVLASRIARLLAPAGVAVLEHGQGQEEAVAAIMTAAGLAVTGRRADLAGILRCVVVGHPAPAEKPR